ncbi:MAG: sigma-70 family RNA polymerase sigma factor, partial [Vicinamibacterales bacterium]
MSDQRNVRHLTPKRAPTDGPPRGPAPVSAAARSDTPSTDTLLAVEIRGLVEQGEMDEARERFGGLVAAHQRRALRIAYQYLRDSADADEAVQDAFIKVFTHISSYREAWPFEVWFTRILINGCLDRRKARARRQRWLVPS